MENDTERKITEALAKVEESIRSSKEDVDALIQTLIDQRASYDDLIVELRRLRS
ncbi:MAG: hypothetical protein ACRYFW_00530 [Janthinobacterium lividum]